MASEVRALQDREVQGDLAPPAMPTRSIEAGGTTIHYCDLPALGREVGAPLLFIHGLGGWLRNWAYNVHHFAALGYRCLAVDLPGFGRSYKPNVAYDLRYFRRTVTAFLDEVRAPRATIVGNSMGGMIALSLAQRHPERVDRLVLVDAAGVHDLRRTAIRVSLDVVGATVRRGPSPRRIMASLTHWVFEQAPPELLQELRMEFTRWPEFDAKERGRRRRAHLRALVGIMRTNLRPWLPGITAPTLVVHGKQDKLVPFEAASIMHREIPGARLAAFDRCGHVPQLEMADRFNRAVEGFLRETASAPPQIPPG